MSPIAPWMTEPIRGQPQTSATAMASGDGKPIGDRELIASHPRYWLYHSGPGLMNRMMSTPDATTADESAADRADIWR
jgi:hypothetical protein